MDLGEADSTSICEMIADYKESPDGFYEKYNYCNIHFYYYESTPYGNIIYRQSISDTGFSLDWALAFQEFTDEDGIFIHYGDYFLGSSYIMYPDKCLFEDGTQYIWYYPQ